MKHIATLFEGIIADDGMKIYGTYYYTPGDAGELDR